MGAAFNGHLDVITQVVRKYTIDVNKREGGANGGAVIHMAMNARVPSLTLIKLLVDDLGQIFGYPVGRTGRHHSN